LVLRHTRWVRFILFFIVVDPIAILVFGGTVMLLWNNMLTPVLHVSTITFWQGIGILVLSKILFSSFNGGGRSCRDYWKQRMMWNNMTPEQKEKFKEEWKNRSRRWGYRFRDSETEVEQPGAVYPSTFTIPISGVRIHESTDSGLRIVGILFPEPCPSFYPFFI
jgi:hypothetical protein